MAGLPPEEIQYQMEHIHENRRGDVVSASITMIVLPTVFVALRFVVRKVKKIPFWWDDWLCLIALPFAISDAVLALVNTPLGYHVLSLEPPQIVRYLKVLYAGELTYGAGIVLVKLSILLFYRRVFPMAHVSRAWRICWWFMTIFSALMITMTIPGIFACKPIAYFWNRTIPGGHCLPTTPFFRSTGIINIFSDVAILLLPLPVLSKLQIGKSKKIGLIGLFLLGGFVCVTSIIRLPYLEAFSKSDPTWTHVDGTIWSFTEPTTALVCACLPVLVPPFCAQVAAFTSSIYSSYSRSKQSSSSKATTITIGQQRSNRRSFAQLGTGKDATNVSEVEMTSPIVGKGAFEESVYGRDDLEKGTGYHARSMES